MDANTIFKLMKPHLDLLTPSEKANLSKLINTPKPRKVARGHRREFSLLKAKEHLKRFCQREIEREKLERLSL